MIQVGQTIGNYRITAKLGEGGMGVVYLAEHPVIGKKVAMKAIHPELSRNPEVVSRFMTEAKSVNQIGNEHIVDISDFGTTPDGEFYFIMEFLQGESLADRLKRDRMLPPARALHIASQVADALGASHSHGIIHRDLKPENIYLIVRGQNKDFVKVLDFGLAKLTQGEDKVSHKTRTGSVMGTPYYMAPEQCEGRPNIDHRADVYSLGVILFEMLTGKVPFGGEGYGEIIVKHITVQPPSPRAVNPTLPESMEKIVFRSLAKAREQRFQNMEEFSFALTDPEGYAAGAPSVRGMDATLMSGAMPVARAEVGSGQVGFGSGLTGTGSPGEMGATSTPMPSTFRSGTGEILDDMIEPRRSGRGVAVGVALAAVIGAGVAFFVFNKGNPVQTTLAGLTGSKAGARKPATVKLNFSSTPGGARVVRNDTGAELGTTPFAIDLPVSDKAITFVYKKDGFDAFELPVIPNVAALLLAPLRETPKTAPPSPSPAAEKADSTKPARKASSHRRPSKPSKMDEDAVMEPTFK